ncbi:MAG: glycosyltransferase family 2 protein [Pyrinomonadaceae bacterium]
MNETSIKVTVSRGSHVAPEPAISIVIPNYNTALYIAETLDSVFAQTFANFEVIVINDASPDTADLPGVLAPYRDRIVFIDKDINEGTSSTRNRGAGYARAAVISFLDADDIWFPTYLAELYDFLQANAYDMAYADAETFLTGTTEKYHDLLHCNPEQGDVTRRMLIDGRCHILPTGTLIRKAAFEEIGGFDPSVARTEDFDLWMRLLFAEKRVGYLRKILFKFRLSPGSGSGDSVVRLQRNGDVWRVLQKKLPFTTDETKVIAKHIGEADAGVVRAKGRFYINERNWPAARAAFSDAIKRAEELRLPLSHRLKMRAILLLLHVSPRLVWRMMRRLRSEELEYMPLNNTA